MQQHIHLATQLCGSRFKWCARADTKKCSTYTLQHNHPQSHWAEPLSQSLLYFHSPCDADVYTAPSYAGWCQKPEPSPGQSFALFSNEHSAFKQIISWLKSICTDLLLPNCFQAFTKLHDRYGAPSTDWSFFVFAFCHVFESIMFRGRTEAVQTYFSRH